MDYNNSSHRKVRRFKAAQGYRLMRFVLPATGALAALVAAFALTAWLGAASPLTIELPADLVGDLQAGDLIFRIGDGWQSDAVRGAGRSVRQSARQESDPYSHVGMLVGEPSHWRVLHAVPAELPGRKDEVVLDDLDFFIAPERAHGVAVYRIAAETSVRAAAVENAMKRLGAPFMIVENDLEGQYCTTLIWHAWKRAGVDLGARFDDLNIPFAAGQYLLPHSLRAAPELNLLFEARAEKRR